MDNTYVLIGFGVLAFGALLYLIYKQYKDGQDQMDEDAVPNEIPQSTVEESDSYYEESEVYSD